ncbi:MAG TPA: helix-turn-helix transcriptional regulator [Methylomirabilota bacterium]|nr:helix-turn-helix transcriptional regulator [Methylomirabilota bacterium]
MDDRNADQFRQWLRRQLRSRRMSLRQLAAHSGVSASTVSRVVRGDRQPSLQTALRLANVLRAAGDDFNPAAQIGAMVDRFEPATDIERALRADSRLSEADVRRIMLMYHSLRRPAGAKPGAPHRTVTREAVPGL